jgi:hypothetical protein
LPPGIHDAILEEVRDTYATNLRRRTLFKGLSQACKSLKSAGCSVIYLDGSYVTEKTIPGDYDVCWDPEGVDTGKLDPVFLDFKNNRAAQKSKYGGEFFPSSAKSLPGNEWTFVKFFQKDKETGADKGIIRIHL